MRPLSVLFISFGVTLAPAVQAAPSDLDGDGRNDCWSRQWDGGSGFGGWTIELAPGCGSRIERVRSFGSFGEQLEVMTASAGLSAAMQAGLRRALWPDEVLRCEPAGAGCPGIDGSFAWLLDEVTTRDQAGPRHYTPRWATGRPTVPPTQVIDLMGPDAVRIALRLDAGEPDVAALTMNHLVAGLLGRAEGWVVYPAHMHGALALAATCDRFEVWTTAHAVSVVDRARDRWSWVYVSTAGDKLRHRSIDDARCDGDTVIIARRGPDGPESIVVSPDSGRWKVRDVRP